MDGRGIPLSPTSTDCENVLNIPNRETRKHTKLTELTESTENPKILHNGKEHVTEFCQSNSGLCYSTYNTGRVWQSFDRVILDSVRAV